MEVAFLVIAVIGLLALSSGGSVSGGLRVTPNQPLGSNLPGFQPSTPYSPGVPVATPQPVYQTGVYSEPPSTVYTPMPTTTFNPPMVPSTGGPNTGGALITGGAAIGTSILSAGGSSSILAAVVPVSAVPVVGAAIVAVAAIAAAILAAHEKRLQDAKSENQAVDQWIPVFDSFISSVVQAYNSGQINAAYAAKICQQFDQTLYSKFRSFVGQPGTAWNDQIGMAGQCNKQCTVGCCVYFGDLGPPLNNISYVLGYPTGKWGQGDPRINGRTVTIPKVYPSKYSSLSRQLYTVTLN